jgi:broad specificity phosphatase PhoE
LSQVGRQRAAKLAAMLKDGGIKGVYVSAFRRTQETAAPLATEAKLKPELMPPNVPALIAELKAKHARDIVLIVAHSSTISAIIRGLGGSPVDVSEGDYTSLFVVVPGSGATARLRY